MNKLAQSIELLAPAGSMEAFRAAIHNGADAVYLGASVFGARSGAGFDDADLRSAVRYAHLYRKKVYITVNTLIKQNELPHLREVLIFLEEAGADALIVQDLGLTRLIRQIIPLMPVHASTQMSIHNAAGARLMKRYGLERVVLARECSLETIRAVAAEGIETEVFVHGAQCVSVSGQCLLSSHIGGRSGNRGRCAQPCRTAYRYRGQEGAWLSPRDLAQIDRIGDLARAGITSLKIEGRLKRPEYVATVTGIYRKAIDRVLESGTPSPIPSDRKALLQIFNRGGFTEGWAFDKADALQINPVRVSHEGLPLGSVVSCVKRNGFYLAEISLQDTLRSMDHLQIRGIREQEMIYSGPECPAGGRAVLRLHEAAAAGAAVFRLTDAKQLQDAQESYRSPMPSLSVDAGLTLHPGEPSLLSLSHQGISVTVRGAVPESAQNCPIDRETALRSMRKMGDSPFALNRFVFESPVPCFMPASSLNALRRDALQDLQEACIDAYPRPRARDSQAPAPASAARGERDAATLYVRSSRIDLIDRLRGSGMDRFLYSPQDYTAPSLPMAVERLGPHDYFCLPRQADDGTLAQLTGIISKAGLSVMADNVGQLAFDYPSSLLAGPGIPCWNSETAEFLQQSGCRAAILSTELSKTEMEALKAASDFDFILQVYGRAAVMQLNHCPERTFRGLSGSQTACRLCQAEEGTLGQCLEDRMGACFPLSPIRLPDGCLNTLLFHTPLHLGSQAFGQHWLLDFTTEDEQTMLDLTTAYAAMLRGEKPQHDNRYPLYTGRFDEGVL